LRGTPVPRGKGGRGGLLDGGAGGGGGGGAGLQWSETPMPEELTMTYDDFVRETGVKRASIPQVYLKDDEGNEIKRTRNEWWELHRIYAAALEVSAVQGSPGGKIEAAIRREYAAKENEVEMIRRVYESCRDLFSFEMSAPVPAGGDSAHASGSFRCLIAMRVKTKNLRRLLKTMEREFAPYSHYGYVPGQGRQAFRFVTYEHGVWKPKYFWLSNEALDEWDRLWGANTLRVRAYGTDGTVLAESTLNLGHSGTTPFDLLYPPDLKPTVLANEPWVFDLDFAGLRKGFDGGRGINWNNSLGWLYLWTVSGPTEQLSRVDAAEVAFIEAEGQIGSRRVFGSLRKKGAQLAAVAPEAPPLSSRLEGPSALSAATSLLGGGGAPAGGAGAGGPGGMMGGPMGPGGMPGEGGMGMGPAGMPGPGSMGPVGGGGYNPGVPPTAPMMPGI
ncbi:MAG: hypothetical protein J7M26_09355, partial [Armatimonadetes bacterium]|nr:hypothetical protein [Armatimonadota bacterium]